MVLFVSSSFILAGLIGWTRRPQNRTGMLMVAVGFGVLIGVLGEANHSIPFTLGALFGSLFIAAFVHLLLAYPSGRLLSRRARVLVGAGYTIAFLAPLAESMFADARDLQAPRVSRQPRPGLPRSCRARRRDDDLDGCFGPAVRGRRHVAPRSLARDNARAPSHPPVGLPLRRPQHRAPGDRVRHHAFLGSRSDHRQRRADRDLHDRSVHLPRRPAGDGDRTRRRSRCDLQLRPRTCKPRRSPGGSEERPARRDGSGRVLVRGGRALRRRRGEPPRSSGGHSPARRHATRLRRPAGRGDRARRRPPAGAGAPRGGRECGADRTRAGQAARRGTRTRTALSRPAAGDARPHVPDLARREVHLLQRAERARPRERRGRREAALGPTAARTWPTGCSRRDARRSAATPV